MLERSIALGEARPIAPLWLSDAYRLLGEANRLTGRTSEAKKAYERFLEIAPAESIDRAEVTRRLRSL